MLFEFVVYDQIAFKAKVNKAEYITMGSDLGVLIFECRSLDDQLAVMKGSPLDLLPGQRRPARRGASHQNIRASSRANMKGDAE